MPHLHLPADHCDADVALAANLADIVGSEDLYVTWTHGAGAGAVPEVEAMIRDERPPVRGVLGQLAAGLVAVWQYLMHAPQPPAPRLAHPAATWRAGEPFA